MRKLCLFSVFTLTICLWNINAEERSLLDIFVPQFRASRLFLQDMLRQHTRSLQNVKRRPRNNRFQPVEPEERPFPCATQGMRSSERPNTVHKLKPGDIDVIGALGDSITAGWGLTAADVFGVFLEERGKSWSIGGESTWRQYLTLPNILKEFNPNLIGYALRSSLSIERESQFNVAEGGAVSDNMPYMTKVLIQRMKADKRVDMKNDWKMVTLLIGDNDFCSELCYKNAEKALEKHQKDVLKVLRLLRDNLPRTIVNLVVPPSIKILAALGPKPPVCTLTHASECPCIFSDTRQQYNNYYFDIMEKWQNIDIEVTKLPEFDKDDFTVIPHHFFMNFTFPSKANGDSDFSYLSTDCFHFSQKGNALAGLTLWNSLMEPVGRKSTDGTVSFNKFNCPNREKPYIYTNKNSQH